MALANRTPLYDWHVAHGARMVDFAGWDMPIQYASIIEEHQAVRTAAGMFDISHMGRLQFYGADDDDVIVTATMSFLQQIFTNDVSTMNQGQARYGLICNEQGCILDDVLVYNFDPFWLMVVNASNREKVLKWVNGYLGDIGVNMQDLTAGWSMLAIQGPKAAEIVNRTLKASKSLGHLKYYYGRMLAVKETPFQTSMIVSRTGYTGEDGFEIMLPAQHVQRMTESLMNSAQEIGIDLIPCGLGARDTLRLEAAMPLYGHELTEEIDPFQAGLGWAVKLDKGEFIGRDALLRRRQDSTLRQRAGLEMEGKRIAREGAVVFRDGKEVGRVTSGTFAPTLAKAVAMAYLDPVCTAPGTTLEVDVRGKPAPARVVPLPFYKRKP